MKKLAAEKSINHIQNEMIVGLGTGSTVEYMLKHLAEQIKKGLHITGVPTSMHTKKTAEKLGIPLAKLDDITELDITIDGADEVDSNLNLIKGGGGALTREKIIAYNSKKLIIIVDESKVVKGLGANFPIPVEVVKFGWRFTKKSLEELNCETERRDVMENEPFITDNSNYIIDCDFGRIDNPTELEQILNAIPGVVENGLFIGLADEVIVGSKQGVMTLNK